MVRMYASIDPRVRILGYALKVFVKVCVSNYGVHCKVFIRLFSGHIMVYCCLSVCPFVINMSDINSKHLNQFE